MEDNLPCERPPKKRKESDGGVNGLTRGEDRVTIEVFRMLIDRLNEAEDKLDAVLSSINRVSAALDQQQRRPVFHLCSHCTDRVHIEYYPDGTLKNAFYECKGWACETCGNLPMSAID